MEYVKNYISLSQIMTILLQLSVLIEDLLSIVVTRNGVSFPQLKGQYTQEEEEEEEVETSVEKSKSSPKGYVNNGERKYSYSSV